MKKGQLAVETLLIYGIAILIVMLAIGALIAFGVLDLGSLLPDQCQLGDGMECENYEVSGSEVKLELRNTLGKNIQNFSVTVRGTGDNEGLWGCSETNYTQLTVNGELTGVVYIPCDIQVPKGKKIQGIIDLTYFPVGSKISRSITGKIRTAVS